MRAIVLEAGRFVLLLAVLLAAAKDTSAQASQTLKQAVATKSLPVATAKLSNLEKKITSGAQLDDSNQFVIAYYLDDGTGSLNPPLFIDRYDKKRKEWQSAALPDAQTKSPSLDDVCFGSILDIKAFNGRLILDTHINPSAGCLLVLSPALHLEASLDGRQVGQIGPHLVVYERSQVHFAPVHPAEIAIYDIHIKHEETIFPPKAPTAVRQARMAQLRGFYNQNQNWCQKNNDPCDPESFDSSLEGEVATSESESAVAFWISYEPIQFVEGDLQKPPGPKDVLYVYRRLDDPAKMEFREMLRSRAEKLLGDASLEDLLQPGTLQKIFAAPPLDKP